MPTAVRTSNPTFIKLNQYSEILKARAYFVDLCIDGRIILQWILENGKETGGMDSRSSG
jgi:hypothetical protein